MSQKRQIKKSRIEDYNKLIKDISELKKREKLEYYESRILDNLYDLLSEKIDQSKHEKIMIKEQNKIIEGAEFILKMIQIKIEMKDYKYEELFKNQGI